MSGDDSVQERRIYLVIIDRPSGWKPRSEFAMPARGDVIDVVRGRINDPATFVRHYNAASLHEHGASWAGLTETKPRVGLEVGLVSPASLRGRVRPGTAARRRRVAGRPASS